MLFLSMEGFGTIDPIFDCCRDGGHREDHDSEALVQSEGKLVNKSDVVSDSCFGSNIQEVSDVFLESIVSGSIGCPCGLLNKLEEF